MCTRLPKIGASEFAERLHNLKPDRLGRCSFLTATRRSGPQLFFGSTATASPLVFLHSTSSHLKTHLPITRIVISPKPIWLFPFLVVCGSSFCSLSCMIPSRTLNLSSGKPSYSFGISRTVAQGLKTKYTLIRCSLI